MHVHKVLGIQFLNVHFTLLSTGLLMSTLFRFNYLTMFTA